MQQRKIKLHDESDGNAGGMVEPVDFGQAQIPFSDLQIAVTDDVDKLESDWRRLQARPENSLHQSFDWCINWMKANRSQLVVITAASAGQILILLPLEIVRVHGVRVARFPGNRFNNINTGLFDASLALPDATQLRDFANQLRLALRKRADLIVLDNIPLLWRGVAHPLAGLATVENQNHSFQLPLFADFPQTLAQLNAKGRRKKFRSSQRKLEALGGYEHIVLEGREERHVLLDLFFQQKGERLAMLGLPDVFSPPEVRDFFHRLLDVRAEGPAEGQAEGQAEGKDTPLVLHALRLTGVHHGHIAAIAGWSRKGDHVICQFSSIDESICREASPGEMLFWLMIERACQQGAAIFDFGVGDQFYKRNWCRVETVQHDILLPIGWKGSLLRPLLVGMTVAKARLKQNSFAYGLIQRLRSSRAKDAA